MENKKRKMKRGGRWTVLTSYSPSPWYQSASTSPGVLPPPRTLFTLLYTNVPPPLSPLVHLISPASLWGLTAEIIRRANSSPRIRNRGRESKLGRQHYIWTPLSKRFPPFYLSSSSLILLLFFPPFFLFTSLDYLFCPVCNSQLRPSTFG